MKMKKFLALLLTAAMALSLAACGAKEKQPSEAAPRMKMRCIWAMIPPPERSFTAPTTMSGAT